MREERDRNIMLDSLGLTVSYLVVLAALLCMLLYTPWHWLYKAMMILIVSVFFYVTYFSIPEFYGWPTAQHRPQKLQIIAIYIDAPNKIYLWGHDLDYGIAGTRPRAYEFNYSTKLNESLNEASNKLKKGFPMIGEFVPLPNTAKRITEGEAIERPDDFNLIIYDVPEALAPSGEK